MLSWSWFDSEIVLVGALCAAACALPGCFLVLRRMSMMGDAISHAVLPGLAIAFLVTGSRASLPMFVGAAIAGVMTALLTQWVHRLGRVEESASMGVVFTVLFAAGLLLIVRAADAVDLDPGCVLYGSIELSPLDRVVVLGWSLPRAAAQLGAVFLLNLAVVVCLFKELKISSFDPALATTLGINARVMHYLLMTMTAITAVAAFESVGSILVIAMLIVPAAAAHLLTERLHTMLLVAFLLAIASAAIGHLGAIAVPPLFGYTDTSSAGMIAVAAGGLFGAALLLAPRHGVISRMLHQARLAVRVAREDALGLLLRWEESHGRVPMPPLRLQILLGRQRLLANAALGRLARAKLVARDAEGHRLTDDGRNEARRLLRSHRLWETYLHQELNIRPDHVHRPAELLEHITSPAMEEGLAESVDRPAIDPHGKPIPEVPPGENLRN